MSKELLQLFIDGAWRPALTGATMDVVNPANEEILGQVASADDGDVDHAIDAASRGLVVWRNTAPQDRSFLLTRTAALLNERRTEIARILTQENGKTLAESHAELIRASETFAWYGGEAKRLYGSIIPGLSREFRRSLLAEPIGVVAAFTAWNFPAVLIARKLAAALAAGCSVILKAAEETPGTAVALIEALANAGAPKGVVNLLFGCPPLISRRLLESAVVRKVSFTGSTAVGKELARLAAEDLKRCTLELGGHAPVLIFADADMDVVLKTMVASKFGCAGQSCVAPSRFFVHRTRYEEFVTRFTQAAHRLEVGDGMARGVDMGPLATRRRIDAMERLVDDAELQECEFTTGGKRLDRPGYFWPPTVLAEVRDTAKIMREEPFGPIAAVTSFSTYEEAIPEPIETPTDWPATSLRGPARSRQKPQTSSTSAASP